MPGKGRPFVKGDPRIGRKPKGAVEKKWYDLRWWYSLITDNVEKLTPVQKVELGLKGLSLLVSKLPNIPATPKESVENATGIVDVKAELKAAEETNVPQS